MNKEEKACQDMADVCELAHKRTVAECNRLGIEIDCSSHTHCGNGDNHMGDGDDDMHYTLMGQEIFDRHYDDIIEKTGL